MRALLMLSLVLVLALSVSCKEEAPTGAAPYNFQPYAPEGQDAPAVGGCGVAAGDMGSTTRESNTRGSPVFF